MLRAVRPTLATTGGRLVILSSPAGQSGALWDLYRGHFARDEAPVLVWRGSAPEMNPRLPADYLARMAQDDPEDYRSEVLGEFRAGVTALFDPEMLEACVMRGGRERLPEAGQGYQAAADLSGGRRDAFTVGQELGAGTPAITARPEEIDHETPREEQLRSRQPQWERGERAISEPVARLLTLLLGGMAPESKRRKGGGGS
jgi:hypothetical protein